MKIIIFQKATYEYRVEVHKIIEGRCKKEKNFDNSGSRVGSSSSMFVGFL
jgi:hypothetical protein